MLPHATDGPQATTRFIDATLRGGPYDGQHVVLPDDELRHVVYDDMTPHRYIRISHKPVFTYEPDAARLFGGGR